MRHCCQFGIICNEFLLKVKIIAFFIPQLKIEVGFSTEYKRSVFYINSKLNVNLYLKEIANCLINVNIIEESKSKTNQK